MGLNDNIFGPTEIIMGLALRKEDFDIVPAPPAVDWQRAFDAVDDLKGFERTISVAETQMATWRNNIKDKLSKALEKMEESFRPVDINEVREFLFPLLDEAIDSIEVCKKSYAIPFHERIDAARAIETISKVGGGPGRFLRKQINRMEDIRVKQMNAYTDLYYALLAFRSKYEEGYSERETFDDAESLEAFLKSQVA